MARPGMLALQRRRARSIEKRGRERGLSRRLVSDRVAPSQAKVCAWWGENTQTHAHIDIKQKTRDCRLYLRHQQQRLEQPERRRNECDRGRSVPFHLIPSHCFLLLFWSQHRTIHCGYVRVAKTSFLCSFEAFVRSGKNRSTHAHSVAF